jgi:hypothetical protein
MTLTEAIEIVNRRRQEAFRGKGYVDPEEARMAEEIDAIQRSQPFMSFVNAGKELLGRGVPVEVAFAAVNSVVLCFGIDVGRLLQSANAEKPQPASEPKEEHQTTAIKL